MTGQCPLCYRGQGLHEGDCRWNPVNIRSAREAESRMWDELHAQGIEYGGEGY